MLFPSFQHRPALRINLDEEGARWLEQRGGSGESAASNPLLDPVVCQQMVDEAHRREGAAWSYGGYLENRRRLWRGSYLERTGSFIHLGVDFTVPQGTPWVAGYPAGVVVVDDDHDRDGGWGQRIILRPDLPGTDVLLIFAHLQEIRFKPGDRIPAGTVVAEVGGPPDNGNWHPHLHVQAIRRACFEEILVNRFATLDGYGHPDDLALIGESFPDPLPFVAPELAVRP